MKETELRRLNRGELLQMLVLQSEENEKLKERIENLEQSLKDRAIAISESGTLSEAALRLNGVFEAADQAVEQYKENLSRMVREQEAVVQSKMSDAQAEAAEIVKQARQEAEARKQEAEAYWKALTVRLEAFYREHEGLKEMLEAVVGG